MVVEGSDGPTGLDGILMAHAEDFSRLADHLPGTIESRATLENVEAAWAELDLEKDVAGYFEYVDGQDDKIEQAGMTVDEFEVEMAALDALVELARKRSLNGNSN